MSYSDLTEQEAWDAEMERQMRAEIIKGKHEAQRIQRNFEDTGILEETETEDQQ